jgi:hypothetical protein
MFIDQAPMESPGVDALIVLEAEGRVGRAMVTMAIQSRLPVVAVSLDPRALRLLKLENPGADLEVLVGSVVDVRSAVWLADDVRKLHRKISGVIAPIEAPDGITEAQRSRGDALDVLRNQIRTPAASSPQVP